MDELALYARFGHLVRLHRKRLSLNQAEIGKAVGLSRASVANIETGRQRIPIHHLYRLARVLEVDVHALLPAPDNASPANIHREIQCSIKLSDLEQEAVAKVIGLLDAEEKRGAR
jgi:transcriptional regulator with XRE-family HTH domain